MLPLIVLDCSRSLNAMPAVGVRCKALNNRADALEEIDEDTSLMQAICDMDVAIRVAAAQLSSADAKLKAISKSNGPSPRKAKAQAKKQVCKTYWSSHLAFPSLLLPTAHAFY